MGNEGTKLIAFRNESPYLVSAIDGGGHFVRLNPGQTNGFVVDVERSAIQLNAYDDKNRLVKQADYISGCYDSWAIYSSYILHHTHANFQSPGSRQIQWGVNNEAAIVKMDADIRKAEEDARRRAQMAARQEEVRRRQVAARLKAKEAAAAVLNSHLSKQQAEQRRQQEARREKAEAAAAARDSQLTKQEAARRLQEARRQAKVDLRVAQIHRQEMERQRQQLKRRQKAVDKMFLELKQSRARLSNEAWAASERKWREAQEALEFEQTNAAFILPSGAASTPPSSVQQGKNVAQLAADFKLIYEPQRRQAFTDLLAAFSEHLEAQAEFSQKLSDSANLFQGYSTPELTSVAQNVIASFTTTHFESGGLGFLQIFNGFGVILEKSEMTLEETDIYSKIGAYFSRLLSSGVQFEAFLGLVNFSQISSQVVTHIFAQFSIHPLCIDTLLHAIHSGSRVTTEQLLKVVSHLKNAEERARLQCAKVVIAALSHEASIPTEDLQGVQVELQEAIDDLLKSDSKTLKNVGLHLFELGVGRGLLENVPKAFSQISLSQPICMYLLTSWRQRRDDSVANLLLQNLATLSEAAPFSVLELVTSSQSFNEEQVESIEGLCLHLRQCSTTVPIPVEVVEAISNYLEVPSSENTALCVLLLGEILDNPESGRRLSHLLPKLEELVHSTLNEKGKLGCWKSIYSIVTTNLDSLGNNTLQLLLDNVITSEEEDRDEVNEVFGNILLHYTATRESAPDFWENHLELVTSTLFDPSAAPTVRVTLFKIFLQLHFPPMAPMSEDTLQNLVTLCLEESNPKVKHALLLHLPELTAGHEDLQELLEQFIFSSEMTPPDVMSAALRSLIRTGGVRQGPEQWVPKVGTLPPLEASGIWTEFAAIHEAWAAEHIEDICYPFLLIPETAQSAFTLLSNLISGVAPKNDGSLAAFLTPGNIDFLDEFWEASPKNAETTQLIIDAIHTGITETLKRSEVTPKVLNHLLEVIGDVMRTSMSSLKFINFPPNFLETLFQTMDVLSVKATLVICQYLENVPAALETGAESFFIKFCEDKEDFLDNERESLIHLAEALLRHTPSLQSPSKLAAIFSPFLAPETNHSKLTSLTYILFKCGVVEPLSEGEVTKLRSLEGEFPFAKMAVAASSFHEDNSLHKNAPWIRTWAQEDVEDLKRAAHHHDSSSELGVLLNSILADHLLSSGQTEEGLKLYENLTTTEVLGGVAFVTEQRSKSVMTHLENPDLHWSSLQEAASAGSEWAVKNLKEIEVLRVFPEDIDDDSDFARSCSQLYSILLETLQDSGDHCKALFEHLQGLHPNLDRASIVSTALHLASTGLYVSTVPNSWSVTTWQQHWLREAFLQKHPHLTPPTFSPLWDSMILHHSALFEDVPLLSEVLLKCLHSSLNPLKSILYLMATPDLALLSSNLDEGDEVEIHLQLEFLQNHLPSQDISPEDSDSFWREIWSGPFAPNVVFLPDFLATFPTAPVSSIADFLATSRIMNHPFEGIKSLVLNSTTLTPSTLAELREKMELQAVHSEINKIRAKCAANVESEFSLDNCLFLLQQLLSTEVWTFPKIFKLLQLASSEIELQKSPLDAALIAAQFAQIIDIIYGYALGANVVSTLESDASEPDIFSKLFPALHEACLEKLCSLKSAPKEDSELLEEAIQLNLDKSEELEAISKILTDIPHDSVSSWGSAQIKSWARNPPDLTSPENFSTTLAVLCRGVEIVKKYRPRSTQLLAVLSLLTPGGRGRLAKINTGEGKSVTVVMIAIIKALQGLPVDVITSSSLLAQRDAAEFAELYGLFGVTVADCVSTTGKKGMKSCYVARVVYGDASSFQGDLLRNDFSRLGTRGLRRLSVTIVDEVDSMLIDQGGHATRLVDKMPGMEALESVYISIWSNLSSLVPRIIELEEGRKYFLDEPPKDAVASDMMQVWAHTLPKDRLPRDTFANSPALRRALEIFADQGKQAELANPQLLESVAQLLNNEEFVISFPEVAKLLQDRSRDDQVTDDLVRKYVEARWNLNSHPVLLSVLELLVQVKLLVFEVFPSEGIVLSPTYHPELPVREDVDSSGDEIRFLITNSRIFVLTPIEDENNLLKQKITSILHDNFAFGPQPKKSLKIKLPHHLQQLFYAKIPKWIDSAITALVHAHENRDYLIKTNEETGYRKVVPVDFDSTGVLQESTVWSDGLHQFLHIKHKLATTPESLATNFEANLTYFRRYPQVIGLTGTLGSAEERQMLCDIYGLDTIDIPTFKPKQHFHLTDIVTVNEDCWRAAILNSVLAHLRQNRAVLVICKFIQDVSALETYIRQELEENCKVEIGIEKYTRSDNEEVGAVADRLAPRQVVLATNLAGRGTDIKLSDEVVDNGGLHVCITFLPSNLRVEEQAAGRAARQGQPGSSQLIINLADAKAGDSVTKENLLNPKILKKSRDEEEAKKNDKIRTDTIPELEFDSQVFRHYSEIRTQIRAGGPDKAYKYDAADERWGIQMDIAKLSGASRPEMAARYHGFFNHLQQDKEADSLIQNPIYYIREGNERNTDEQYESAMWNFDQAIRLDSIYSYNAQYFKAFSLINEMGDDYKVKAVDCLAAACDTIAGDMIPALIASHNLLQSEKSEEISVGGKGEIVMPSKKQSELTTQTVNKISLLQVQMKAIQEALGEIPKHKEVKATIMNLEDYFRSQKMDVPKAEVEAVREVGLCGFIKVEKRPPPWYAVFVVILVGAIQAVVGAAIAIASGGAFGTGLISDGIGDIVKGVEAAVNGDYIDLKEHFKEKGIALAISLAASAAGAAISSAVNAVQAAVMDKVAKFTNSAIGRFTSSAASNMSKFFGNVAEKIRSLASSVGDKLSDLASKTGLSSLWSKTTDMFKKAWESVKSGCEKAWNKVSSYFPKQPALQLGDAFNKKLLLGAKLIGSEMFNQGFTKIMNLALDKSILDPLEGAIQSRIKTDVKTSISKEFTEGRTGQLLKKGAKSAGTEAELKTILRGASSLILSQIVDDSTTSEEVQYTFQFLRATSAECKRILSGKGYQHWAGAIISTTVNTIVTSVEFGTTVAEIVNYVEGFYGRLVPVLESSLEESEAAPSPYIDTEGGNMEFHLVLETLVDQCADQVATQMAEMVKTGIIKPNVTDIAVGKLTEVLNPFKQDDILKEIQDGYTRKYYGIDDNVELSEHQPTDPRRNNAASLFHLFGYNLPKQSVEMPNPGGGQEPSKTAPVAPPDTRELAELSAATGRRVERFSRSKTDGSLQIDVAFGKLDRSSSLPPMRFLYEDGGRYSAIGGKKIGNSTGSDSLIAAAASQSGNRKEMTGIINFCSKKSIKLPGDSEGLNLAEFKLLERKQRGESLLKLASFAVY